MAEQNLIAPQLSLGPGTQSHTAAPLSFSAVWHELGLCLSTPSSQSVVTHPGELAALFPSPCPWGLSCLGDKT